MSKHLKAITMAVLTLGAAGAMASDAHTVSIVTPAFTACAKGALMEKTWTFEEVSNEATLNALYTKPSGGCWERLGERGTEGYAAGDVRAVKTATLERIEGLGTVNKYDVFVGDKKVGEATRYITTDKPLPMNREGFVVSSGNLGVKHTKTTEVGFQKDAFTPRVFVNGVAAPVGSKVSVLVDFEGGKRTYSIAKGGV